MVLPDEESQLVPGCEGMVLSISGISHKLNLDYGVQDMPCQGTQSPQQGGTKDSRVKKRLSILRWEILG